MNVALSSQYEKGIRLEAMQKQRSNLASAHFGKVRRCLHSLLLYNPARRNGPNMKTQSSVAKYSVAKCRLAIPLVLLIACLALRAPAQQHPATELTVAAAADLSSVLNEIAANYEKKSGVTLKLSFGASGALTQQIQNGAPFDVFFSADMDFPRQLIAAGQADGPDPYQYAVGKLVLWVPADSPLDVEHKGISVLLDPSVKKIAIANPQHAPYGRAAVAALKHAGLYDQISDKLVLGENISQAAQFAESGNAQVGFVALAHAAAPSMQGKGKYWQIPADFYPPLAQGVVVISHSPHKKEATEFVAYMKTKEATDLLRKYGFTVP
jgi:molybdate transport system substrate-binding protein